jgi:hypothetical protein
MSTSNVLNCLTNSITIDIDRTLCDGHHIRSFEATLSTETAQECSQLVINRVLRMVAGGNKNWVTTYQVVEMPE